MNTYDVIVIGGGHAGTEAALASARMGAQTLLLTHNIETIGQMSCNPAIGGIGKSHLVREIDALGGIMGRAADISGIQFRVLNGSKGPAVRATRAQADRVLYKNAIRQFVESQPNLAIFQQAVDDVLIENNRIVGVVTQCGLIFKAAAVVLTTGTFLGGQIRLGNTRQPAGRAGDQPAIKLAQRLREVLPRVGRLKTGTPPRVDGKTINYNLMQVQPGDTPLPQFSYLMPESRSRQVPCHITHTTEKTSDIIRKNLHLSPMYSEQDGIDSVGPRYCPSIEDKIVRFADKASHQIFVEPEGLNTYEVYPNGISTSLPYDIQLAFVRSITGFKRARITRPGYAIEYDYFDPRDLHPWLETKTIPGLFFAGQINGTTGYEEAAAQGLLAGLNAARQSADKAVWWPRRDQGYLGVLVDDLITNGTREPYRMFTSRAEYRLSLREDNADLRLTPTGRELGLVDDHRWKVFEGKCTAIENEQAKLRQWVIHPKTQIADQIAETGTVVAKEVHAIDLLKRPDFAWYDLETLLFENDTPKDAREQVVIQARYEGYLKRQAMDIAKLSHHESVFLPIHLNYHSISGLSAELVEKLSDVKPATLGQASRISGMTPAALSLLLVHLKKTGQLKAQRVE